MARSPAPPPFTPLAPCRAAYSSSSAAWPLVMGLMSHDYCMSTPYKSSQPLPQKQSVVLRRQVGTQAAKKNPQQCFTIDLYHLVVQYNERNSCRKKTQGRQSGSQVQATKGRRPQKAASYKRAQVRKKNKQKKTTVSPLPCPLGGKRLSFLTRRLSPEKRRRAPATSTKNSCPVSAAWPESQTPKRLTRFSKSRRTTTGRSPPGCDSVARGSASASPRRLP